jgi:hypothetical protein
MDLIAKVMGNPRGIATLSCIATAMTWIAIVAFGAPPTTFIVVAWGGSIVLATSKGWVERRLGRR